MSPAPSDSKHKDFDLDVNSSDHVLTLSVKGKLDKATVPAFLKPCLHSLREQSAGEVHMDLSGVGYLDGAGLSALMAVEREAKHLGLGFTLVNPGERIGSLLSLVDWDELAAKRGIPARRRDSGLIDRLGHAAIQLVRDVYFQINFVGELVYAFGFSLRHPAKVRWGDVVNSMERVGVDALPIIGLISLLVGLVMGFQGAVSLSEYGVGVLLAKLVGLIFVQEMGPLITAIMVAGRSGSAFASEIGTMTVSEEIDALTTMGISPTHFVAVPKVIATLVVMPFLTLYADVVGIAGGMIVGVSMLDISFSGYVVETMSSIELWDVVHGSIKSMIFAVLISGVGCLRGFQTRGGAEGVGRQTTSAVVTGIFLVVLANALYRIGHQALN